MTDQRYFATILSLKRRKICVNLRFFLLRIEKDEKEIVKYEKRAFLNLLHFRVKGSLDLSHLQGAKKLGSISIESTYSLLTRLISSIATLER